MTVTFAATQFACTEDSATNIASAERVVRQAVTKGAQVILLQELFETPVFLQGPPCQPLRAGASGRRTARS